MFETPVLFLIFNRPETTALVFAQIKKVQPKFLFVAADGPRKNKDGEEKKCSQAREIVMNEITWNCVVKTLFRDDNLGCGRAVSESITWFFENVEEGIILEDDTVPDLSFFSYCANLLDRYRMNLTVMHISGCYFLKNHETSPADLPTYYFSKHIHVWGWATWKRAWKNYDLALKNFTPNQNQIQSYFGRHASFWNGIFTETKLGNIDTWDYQWMYCICTQNGLAINPTTNLIKNVGFNTDATHTKDNNSLFSAVETAPITQLNHPTTIKVNEQRDEHYSIFFLKLEIQKTRMFKSRIRNLMKRIFPIINSDIKIVAKEFTRLKAMPRFTYTETTFMKKIFCVPDAASFLSSVNEIFERKIYKYNSSQNVPVIIDCGANIGLATLYFKLNYPNAKVLAFEPDPNIFTALKNNISGFNFSDVELFNEAIGEKEAALNFQIEGGHSGMLVEVPTDTTIKVNVTALKDVLARFKMVDFLKIDIEGFEIKVLPSIKEELKKVNYLFLEYHTFIDKPQELSTIITIIENAGFRYYIKEGANKNNPFLEGELFYKMDMLLNIFCYRQ